LKRLDGMMASNIHFKWRPHNPPVLRVYPDEPFEVIIPDSSTSQIKPNFTVKQLAAIDESKFDGAVGPVYVDGANPGDTLEVILDTIEVGDWGWTAILNNFGLLKGSFEETFVVWEIRDGWAATKGDFLAGVRIPVRPFLGVVGAAPAEGEFGMIPPRYFGGNMDNRLLRGGSHLFLPVSREGGLVSFADPHASQGDGEVCGTAIETSARITVRIRVHKNTELKTPMMETSEEEVGERVVTMGISNDLYSAAKEALLQMIHYLGDRGFTPEEAYVLCSVAGNLRISEIVDEPNYVVSLVLPKELTRKQ
jgi:acetamidase/formamidase